MGYGSIPAMSTTTNARVYIGSQSLGVWTFGRLPCVGEQIIIEGQAGSRVLAVEAVAHRPLSAGERDGALLPDLLCREWV